MQKTRSNLSLGFGESEIPFNIIEPEPDTSVIITNVKDGDILIFRDQEQAFVNEPSIKLVDGGNF